MQQNKTLRGVGAIVAIVLLAVGVSGCVSMKSYRETKAQMLWDELEIARQAAVVDSLWGENDALSEELEKLDKELESVERELTEVKSENSRLKVENALQE